MVLEVYHKNRALERLHVCTVMCLYVTCTEPQLIASLSDLFGAGTETTANTTLWTIVFMLQHPDIMLKVQEEIDSQVGRDKTLSNADRGMQKKL